MSDNKSAFHKINYQWDAVVVVQRPEGAGAREDAAVGAVPEWKYSTGWLI
jgi:hypothetical protein